MRHTPDLSGISASLAEAFGAREVYGEPIERDGAIVIPAARVWSGGGAGGGSRRTAGAGRRRWDRRRGRVPLGWTARADCSRGLLA